MWLRPLSGIVLLACAVAYAQDTRKVSEPRFPASCTVLTARLAAPGGVLADASEKLLDTDRIQKAIDHCAPGKAVELKPMANNNVFLTAPILLKRA